MHLLLAACILARVSGLPVDLPLQDNAGVRASYGDVAVEQEFFLGADDRPLLETISPENGAVLDRGELEIRLRLNGYSVPSMLHDSRICLGLASQGERVAETCFQQTSSSLEFHASGLQAGKLYMLRAVLLERSSTLAVSVTSFRVGGVSIGSQGTTSVASAIIGSAGEEHKVTFHTALQVAVEHHITGAQAEAEEIYRQIIVQDPTNMDALHLLGLIMYQRGLPLAAMPYLERALDSSPTAVPVNVHNSLGQCLRALGRQAEAVDHYKAALKVNDNFHAAKFNLALAYQELNQISHAAELYSELLSLDSTGMGGVEDDMLMEAATRKCDLMGLEEGRSSIESVVSCWIGAVNRWPHAAHLRNELGNALLLAGDLLGAGMAYKEASSRGMVLAALNEAIVLELTGHERESEQRYTDVLTTVRAYGGPDRRIMIKLATIMPRVMPAAPGGLTEARTRVEHKLDALLALSWDGTAVDNSQPLRHGFSLAHHWAFHGRNNRALKSKLAQVYALFCPALLTGAFVDEGNIMESMPPLLPVPSHAVAVGTHTSNKNPFDKTDDGLSQHFHDHMRGEDVEISAEDTKRLIKVGFASRFFFSHAVGVLIEGIIQMLPRSTYEVHVFNFRPWTNDSFGSGSDPITSRIAASADFYHNVYPDLSRSSAVIRAEQLDVLIYPEIGLDPVTYFLSFQRLARVQAVWWGHPDTSGVPTIDYFISSSAAEVPGSAADALYTEKLYRMRGLAAYFHRPVLLDAEFDRMAVRRTMQQQLNLPPNFHLYLVPQALVKIHPDFDAMLMSIVSKDRLAHLLLLNGSDRVSWSEALMARVSADMTADQSARTLFYKVKNEQEMLALYEVADVVLDCGGYLPTLQALSVGAPVVTLPGETLWGRFALAMYEKLGITELVAKSSKDYVNLAMRIAHNDPVRESLRSRILSVSYRLFHDATAIEEWDKFLSNVHTQARIKEEDATTAEAAAAAE